MSEEIIFKLELVESDSDHPLAKYVEDDEDLFVTWIDRDGGYRFCIADEFFYSVDVKAFKIIEVS